MGVGGGGGVRGRRGDLSDKYKMREAKDCFNLSRCQSCRAWMSGVAGQACLTVPPPGPPPPLRPSPVFGLRFVSLPLSSLSVSLSLCLRPHLAEHIASGPGELTPGTLRRPHSSVAKAARAKETSGMKTLSPYSRSLPLSLSLPLSAGRRAREFGNACERRVTAGDHD